MNRTWRTVVGVMGAGECDEETASLARAVGRGIAERGGVLLCGGRGGVMEAAAAGAREAGGMTLGVLPGRNAAESPPNPHIDIALFTGLGDGRNYVNVCSSDVIIALEGAWGTLSEIALAKKAAKPVVLLGSFALEGDFMRAKTAKEAVALAFEAVPR